MFTVPMPRAERLVLVGLFGTATVLLLAVVAAGLLLLLMTLLLLNGRLIWIVVGIVRETVLFGDEPGLPNKLDDPFVKVGVGVVEGDAE